MRADVRGRFFYAEETKIYLRGVTYGTFSPATGEPFPEPWQVDRDFALMAQAGMNSVRTYTPAPRWLLDLAQRYGLLVLAGLPWEEHVTFLDQRDVTRAIERRVRDGIRGMAGHPALFAYTIGNEIPGSIARWHGRRATERFIERLYVAAKEEDPEGLVTYVNFPTTEYLQLPFVDFLSFNVYLEHQRALESYLARLHNLAGEKPLVMAEIGLDSRRNGEDVQATALEWQIGTAFASGCAGAYVFAWTDEWHRGGFDVRDWDFGLVDRQRRPKRALTAVSRAFERLHRDPMIDLPSMSVVVCTYNGARWLPGCLDALSRVEYPSYEVIVVDDGSTDGTADIAAARPGVRLVRSETNGGLSDARNRGLAAASGEVVAYLDDDARPDPDWLGYLGTAFARTPHVAIGGPNLAPRRDGDIADCVANAPGGPVHVLLGDELAEHVPGCNLAVRREALEAIGGFDERFRIAGDDVDVCWRLQDAGGTIGFSPGAMVWHHRRNSVRTYLRQQLNYGRAEALLERKWPERYNRVGHLSWMGRIYGAGARMTRTARARVGYGTWGTALFQSIYEPAPTLLASIALMPEWFLVLTLLAVVSALGLLWTPLLLAAPVLVVACGAVVLRAYTAADRRHEHAYRRLPRRQRMKLRALTTALHIAQPVARLVGRLDKGLSPWRRRGRRVHARPRPRRTEVWSERWAEPSAWLARLESELAGARHPVRRGAAYDRWDLEVRGGPLGVSRVLCVVEEHGGGRQLLRFRSWPRVSRVAIGSIVVLAALAVLAAMAGELVVASVFGALGTAVAATAVYDSSVACGALVAAVASLERAAAAASAAPPRPIVMHRGPAVPGNGRANANGHGAGNGDAGRDRNGGAHGDVLAERSAAEAEST